MLGLASGMVGLMAFDMQAIISGLMFKQRIDFQNRLLLYREENGAFPRHAWTMEVGGWIELGDDLPGGVREAYDTGALNNPTDDMIVAIDRALETYEEPVAVLCPQCDGAGVTLMAVGDYDPNCWLCHGAGEVGGPDA